MGSHWKDFKKVNHMTYLCILGVTLRINCHGITLPTSLLFQKSVYACLRVIYSHIYSNKSWRFGFEAGEVFDRPVREEVASNGD